MLKLANAEGDKQAQLQATDKISQLIQSFNLEHHRMYKAWARAQLSAGNTQQALAVLERVAKQQPDSDENWQDCANALKQAGKVQQVEQILLKHIKP